MYPILVLIGSIHLYSFSISIVTAWFLFSFILWRHLKDAGTEEEKIYNLTFYSTIITFICSRLAYVLFHWNIFNNDVIKIMALWVAPGFSFYGALISNVITISYLSRQYKLRFGYILDSLAFAYSSAIICGLIGTFLDGTRVGILASVPWAISYIGHVGGRHPIQIYQLITVLVIITGLVVLSGKAKKEKWPYGIIGIWFFIFMSVSFFMLEFLEESTIYWLHLTANQWALVAIFCESLGVLYVKGQGKEFINPKLNHVRNLIRTKGETLYAIVSKRFIRKNSSKS